MTTLTMPVFTQTKQATSNVTVQSNMPRKDVTAMSIDAEGAVHIMSMLTNLYTNPALAVLREYSSNAWDSHVAAGQKRPIEISLPGRLNPVFVVKDYGVGMSPADIRDIYLTFGKSTKRQSMDQIGAFGLGSKSALTLVKQFSVTAVKNGVKTVAIIAIGENETREGNIVSIVETNEPNGVTVSVPVPDVTEFLSHVEGVFLGWPVGSVLVDGQAPKSVYDGGSWMHSSDNLVHVRRADLYNQGNADGFFKINSGGIIYQVSVSSLGLNAYGSRTLANAFSYSLGSLQMVVDVPIGSVDLTPSRDSLLYSERTKKFLTALFESSIRMTTDLALNDIAEATSHNDAIERVECWTRVLGRGKGVPSGFEPKKATWKGSVIPVELAVNHHQHIYLSRNRAGNYRVSQQSRDKINLSLSGYQAKRTVYYVVGDEKVIDRVSKDFKSYLTQTAQSHADTEIIVLDKVPTSEWITKNTKFKSVRVEVIAEAAKKQRAIDRANAGTGRARGTLLYPVVVVEKDSQDRLSVLHEDEIPAAEATADDYYVEEGCSWWVDCGFEYTHGPRAADYAQRISDLGLIGKRVIFIRSTRSAEVFLDRAKTSVKPLGVRVREYTAELMASLTDEDKALRDYSQSYAGGKIVRSFAAIAVLEIEDEEILAFAKKVKASVDTRDATVVRWFGSQETASRTAMDDLLIKFNDLMAKYPLVGFNGNAEQIKKHSDHVVTYINAIHKGA